MTSMTSSAGIGKRSPASASSLAAAAWTAADTFRVRQGTSTRPATGSQISPSIPCKVNATLSHTCSGVPPRIAVSAAAAIAAALPVSA
jgi:hypothetical protein